MVERGLLDGPQNKSPYDFSFPFPFPFFFLTLECPGPNFCVLTFIYIYMLYIFINDKALPRLTPFHLKVKKGSARLNSPYRLNNYEPSTCSCADHRVNSGLISVFLSPLSPVEI